MDKWISLMGLSARKFFFNGSMKANGVILGDMVTRLNTTHTLVASAFALQNGLAYIISPITKFSMDIFSGRQLCILGGFLVGLCYLGCGLWVQSVWQLFVMFTISGIGFGLLSYPTYMNMQAHFQERFSTMSAIASLFDFIGVAALPPLLQFMKDAFGFEESLILFGAIMWHLVAMGVSYREPSYHRRHSIPEREGENRLESSGAEGTEMNRKSKIIRSVCAGLFSLFNHTNWTILLIIDTIAVYVYIAWALFLVSLGTSVGLSEERAVLLSASGGAGGLIGKVCAVFMFRYGYINAYTGGVFPLTINGICLFGCALTGNFLGLVVLNFVIGVSLAISGSALYGILPDMVCSEHLSLAVVVVHVANGIALLFGGFVSGALHDLFGSTIYVYVFNGILCFLVIPLALLWAHGGQSVGECRPDKE